MKRFLAMVVGSLGLGALLRLRRRRPAAELGPDPAGELRARLAQSKAADVHPEPAEPETPPAGPESRRRDVHDRARQAIDELR